MRSIIFDFDGTIADSKNIVIAEVQKKLSPAKPYSSSQIEKMRSMEPLTLYRHLNPHFWQLPGLIKLVINTINHHRDDINIYPGTDSLIKSLHQNGYDLYILSSNRTDTISKIINRYSLGKYFQSIIGGVGLFGKHLAIKSAIGRYHLEKDQCLYIGDEIRDVRAAKKCKIGMIAVDWGYNSQKLLKKDKPYAVVGSIKELEINIDKYFGGKDE